MIYEIYELVDPRDGLVRYVGKSGNAENRYRAHMSPTDNSNKAKDAWIAELKQAELRPELRIVAVVAEDVPAADAERKQVELRIREGHPILNVYLTQEGIYISENKPIHFKPMEQCRQQLTDLAAWTNQDVTSIINRAVAELYWREVDKFAIIRVASTTQEQEAQQ